MLPQHLTAAMLGKHAERLLSSLVTGFQKNKPYSEACRAACAADGNARKGDGARMYVLEAWGGQSCCRASPARSREASPLT